MNRLSAIITHFSAKTYVLIDVTLLMSVSAVGGGIKIYELRADSYRIVQEKKELSRLANLRAQTITAKPTPAPTEVVLPVTAPSPAAQATAPRQQDNSVAIAAANEQGRCVNLNTSAYQQYAKYATEATNEYFQTRGAFNARVNYAQDDDSIAYREKLKSMVNTQLDSLYTAYLDAMSSRNCVPTASAFARL